MPDFTPTPEQLAILEAARTTKDNLVVSALAGAAKTSTLVLLAHALQGKAILSLAFNKRIADEMKTRMPSWCDCMTLNSLGHRVWGQALGKRLTVDTEKGNKLLREYIELHTKKDSIERSALFDGFGDILRTFRFAKSQGYIPAGIQNSGRSLCPLFYDELEEELPQFMIRCIDDMLLTSINLAYSGTIDFDDQIYMPTLFGGTFPQYPIVLVDEAQDLSPLNHAMVRKLVGRSTRVIAVGDPNQAIYGFRGAMASSMTELTDEFHMQTLPLTISFRCPISIIENVHWLVPEMRWPEWAKAGLVKSYDLWGPTTIEDRSTVVCRNNAPLFWLGFQLLKARRSVRIVGADIGPALVKILKKFGPDDMPQDKVYLALEEWRKQQEKKSRNASTLADRVECLKIFIEQGRHLSEIILNAERILKSDGTILLMSIHKAKGLEFDTVYHLDPWRCRPRPDDNTADQERNCRYVADTRAKERLFYINRDNFNPEA